jgi:hypothetical protein
MIATYASTILLVTGVLTALAAIGFLFPRGFLKLLFGMTTEDAAAVLLGRHWSLLIALIGGLLVYASFHVEVQVPVMIAATIEKLALTPLTVASPLRKRALTLLVVGADAVMACLYIILLIQMRG